MAANSPKSAGTAGDNELVLCALGGLGEIGMNAYLYGLGPSNAREWLLVDLGITFPGDAEPGVDVVLPDVDFLERNRAALAGIVLTHAHEDHLGAVIDLWPRLKVPIYATPFTAGMLRSKLAEYGGKLKLPLHVVGMGASFTVGRFAIELVTMAHSIPEPSALVLRTPLGTVFHTGDWKLDDDPLVGAPSDVERIRKLGEDGVLACVCDSTNAFRDGHSPSEVAVAKSITDIIKGAKRRVAVTTFASNVARVKAVADAAVATGRELLVVGRAMHRVIEVAVDTGYLPKDFAYHDQTEFARLDASRVLALCTGSQGEQRAAMARIGEGEHPDIKLTPGDTVVFSSRTIPGNEKAVGRVQNNLARMGCEVVTDNEQLVHVTGHPRREELRKMYRWLKPRIAVPMHGEVRHLKENGRIARQEGVAEVLTPINGEVVRIAPGPARIVDEVPVGRLYRDGKLIVSDGDGPVKERRKLSFVGMVAVALMLGRKGELVGEPDCAIDGIPVETDAGYAMEDVVLDAVEGTLKSIPAGGRRDIEKVREALRRAVRSAVEQAWGKRPIVKVLVLMA